MLQGVTVVDVCRGSLVHARVWARGRSKVILLHWCRDPDHWLLAEKEEVKRGSIPLFVFIVGGTVIWDHKNNLEPWNKMAPTDQYKLFTVNMDYSKLKRDRPVFLNFLSPTLHLV